MENHKQLNDSEFVSKLKHFEFLPSDFSHEAHLRLAWIYLRNYGLNEAIEQINDLILSYVSFLGAGNKYNKTLTTAAIYAVFHFMKRSTANNFKDFIDEFSQLKFNFKGLMASHYGFDIYDSEYAKTCYLEPDLLPFS